MVANRRPRISRIVLILATLSMGIACPGYAQLGSAQDPGGHLGSVEQALVAIEVTNTSRDGATTMTRRGNGFVLRCDGFILAPTDLLGTKITVAGQAEQAKQAITVILNPGTGQEKRIEGRQPRFIGRDLRYAVIKLDNLHTPALRTLLPDAVKPGTAVQVAWSAWDAGAGRWTPVQRRETRLGIEDLAAETPGFVPFAEPVDGIPAGAVVVGPDGLSLGIVPGAGSSVKAAGFISHSVLHRATNCVTVLSVPDSEFGKASNTPSERSDTSDRSDRSDTPPIPPMMPVPGGRVRIGAALFGEQPDMEGDIVACIAPFQIDVFEVTNEEYLAYWRTLPDSEKRKAGFRSNYYPWTWQWGDPPFPTDLAKHPVLGVPITGAMGYAKWRGKRLPTPYEWVMAALGPRGDQTLPQWLGNMVQERKQAWERIKGFHEEYLRQHPEIEQKGALAGGAYRLPWIAATPFLQPVSAFSKQVIDKYLDAIWEMWKDPLYVRPVGFRDFDTSACGARDMFLNASELVMPHPGPPALGGARYMEMAWTYQRARPEDPWQPRSVEAITAARPLPPLSRMFVRAMIGPATDELLMWSNLSETLQMLWPVTGMKLTMTSDARTSVLMWPQGRGPYDRLGRPAGFNVWQGEPRHTKREMGLPSALSTPNPRDPRPELLYYLPVGFRCAR